MLMTKMDLDLLAEHAGIVMNDDEEVGIIWRCFATKVTIDFVGVEIDVDYGVEIKIVTIDRPFCPACNPEAMQKPDIFLLSLLDSLPYQYLVSISRYPSLKLVFS